MIETRRVYADTSVFGGAVEPEFCELSKAFFKQVREGKVVLVVSSVVLDELQNAPDDVRNFFAELSPFIQLETLSNAAYQLRQAYLDANIVTEKWAADALHVAMAIVSGCSIIVSWNFKHIVNLRRISMYNAVNEAQGYGAAAICTPPEVCYEEEND